MDREHFDNDNPFFRHKFTDQNMTDFVTNDLPHWKAICDKSDDQVSFRSDAFENTIKGWLLMALAIKYATERRGKVIKITPKMPS